MRPGILWGWGWGLTWLSSAHAAHAAPVEDWGLTALADRVLAKLDGLATRQGSVRSSVLEPLASDVLAWAASRPDLTLEAASEFAYWNFIPQYRGSLLEGAAAPLSFQGRCFQSVTASLAPAPSPSNSTFELTFRADWPVDASEPCTEELALFTTTGWTLLHLDQGTQVMEWALPDNRSPADDYDFAAKGVRVHQFLADLRTTAANLKETALLFEGVVFKTVTERAAARNVDFLERYTMFTLDDRDPATNVNLTRDDVHSGDTFGILRLDGLDPMLAWASGASTGHMTTALWGDDGELYVCESTVQGAYWPKDGIQCHVFETWMGLAANASFHAVHMPLRADLVESYDQAAAWDFFSSTSGLEYGYHTLLWGWLDTVKDNYPCLPPDYASNCLQWELLETVFPLVDRRVPAAADLLWTQALNHRLNTTDLRTAQAWQRADEVGIGASALFSVVEQDAWRYETVNVTAGEAALGQDMVCDVFVCHLLKAASLFDGVDGGREAVNCEEMANEDVYALDFFEDYQQILGDKTLLLQPLYSETAPYPHMDERCESLAPDFQRSDGC